MDCNRKYPYGESSAVCPHVPLEKTESCAICGSVFKFGIPCPTCNAKPEGGPKFFTRSPDTEAESDGGGGGWYFQIKEAWYGPFTNSAEATEVWNDNKIA